MTKITQLFFSIVGCAAMVCVLTEGLNAQTTFTGAATAALDPSDATLWSNGIPSSTNPGTVSSAYNGLSITFNGALNVSGNANLSEFGAFSITQTGGDATAAQFNFNNNADFVYNLDGGSITSESGTFFTNGTTLNVNGGTITKTGGQFRVINGGNLVLNSGSITSEDTRVETAGSYTIAGGTHSATVMFTRGGTMNVSGGVLNIDAPAIAFNQNNGSTANMNNFSGGTINAPNALNFLNNANQLTTISGDFNLAGANITNIFNGGTANTSTLDFTSNWTGSLTLDSSTDWATVFNTSLNADPAVGTGISVNGVLLDGTSGASFADFFVNNGGVITLEAGDVLKGDVDLDGSVTFLDIQPFILLLSANGFQAEADCDCDGDLDFLDIQPFINILAGN